MEPEVRGSIGVSPRSVPIPICPQTTAGHFGPTGHGGGFGAGSPGARRARAPSPCRAPLDLDVRNGQSPTTQGGLFREERRGWFFRCFSGGNVGGVVSMVVGGRPPEFPGVRHAVPVECACFPRNPIAHFFGRVISDESSVPSLAFLNAFSGA